MSAGDAGDETAQHGADHPKQEVEVEAEIAPLLFQRRADEPCEVDAEDDAQRPPPENGIKTKVMSRHTCPISSRLRLRPR